MFTFFQHILRRNRFVVVTLLFLLIDIGYYYWMRSFKIGHSEALYEAINSYTLLFIFSFILQRIHTYYHSRSAITIVHLSIIFIFSLLTNLFVHEYGQWIGEDQPNYLNYLQSAFYIRWFILFLILLTVVNQLWIAKHLVEQTNYINRLVEKERQLIRAEISGIQEQMRPHFLFNSLNSISALVKKSPEQAREMIFQLSDLLRLSMGKGKQDVCTLEEELDYLNLYLSIEKVRFGHRLNVQIDLIENADNYTLPGLILQPLVENAIKYGLYGRIEDLTIQIELKSVGPNLIISINNPYDHESVNAAKGNGFGLSSVRRKLELIYQRQDLLDVQKSEGQFSVHITLPQ